MKPGMNSRSKRAKVVKGSASSSRSRLNSIELNNMERDPMEMALSTDIVMDIILSHLKATDLLACRKVSKFWTKAASSVLRKRSSMMKNISETKHLMKLQACMKKSWDFPFAGLIFDQPWKLTSASAMKFFKNYGARFTSLRLDTQWTIRLQDLAPFINHLPCLSILEAGPSYGRSPPTKLLDSATGQENGRVLKLASLQTFKISSQVNEDVLCGVLAATSPSLRVECLSVTHGILRALKSAGKLQAVSAMTVEENYYGNGLRADELLSAESPTLTKVDFNYGGCLSMQGLKKLLISSQHTLKELRLAGISPSELTWDYPVCTKLTTLTLCLANSSHKCIFQGSHGHNFPALKELELDIVYAGHPTIANLSDDLFIVPSLRVINLDGPVDKDKMESFARSFPNVTEISLTHKSYDSEWSRETDPFDIWSVRAFKFLGKLRIWDYIVKRPTKNFISMDSFLTGIPNVICENLRKLPQMDLTESPFNEILRGRQNILQLKNLKELIVCVMLERETVNLPEDPPLISMVSVWYALEMMPNLQAKFVYEYNSPSSIFFEEEQREQAVLEAAFRHVRDYIQLEPYFDFPQ